MKTTLSLEYFDVNQLYKREIEKAAMRKKNPWVAEILGHTPDGYRRKFVERKRDYTHANSRGTRGVYCWYLLDEGKVYQVQEQISWRNFIRYFCQVRDAQIVKITQEEVDSILGQRTKLEEDNA